MPFVLSIPQRLVTDLFGELCKLFLYKIYVLDMNERQSITISWNNIKRDMFVLC